MTRHDEYGTHLRNILLHSADVLPEIVTNYLKEVTKSSYWDTKEEVLKRYWLLVDYITKDFVNFALEVLIKKPKNLETPVNNLDAIILSLKASEKDFDLGIVEGKRVFEPPAHIQGPFLYLLCKNENEGLRLVQTLTNAAVAKLREQEPNLLPVVINLPSGQHKLWGDSQVYQWYRPDGNAPNAVTCALMALEVWMEQQIERDRDPEELFEKVLSASECSATLGICLGIALAYPSKCLKAALPLVSSPVVWLMDIRRHADDLGGSWKFAPFGQREFIYEQVEERDKRPQRSLDVRNLAMHYMLSEDDSLRTLFEQAVARFTEDLPSLQEEQENPELVAAVLERLEEFQVFGDLANYRLQLVGDDGQIRIEPPEHIKTRNEARLKPASEHLRWLRVRMWAQKTIKEGKAEESMTLEEAVEVTKEFQQSNDFSVFYVGDGNLDSTCLQAIVGVAAAILIADFEWTQAQGLVAWSRDILLGAARMPYQWYIDNHFPSDPKVSAGRGLGVLIAKGVANMEVREQVLQLVNDSQQQVVDSLFHGLHNAWLVDEVLCWNALSLSLSLCLYPKRFYSWQDSDKRDAEEAQRVESLVSTHLSNLKENIVPEIPRIQDTNAVMFEEYSAKSSLYAMPFSELTKNPITRVKILQLADDLMAWTVKKNTPIEGNSSYSYQSDNPYEWNRFFFNWVSSLGQWLSLEEVRQHILDPIRDSWSKAPQLTINLLDAYISYQIGYMEPLRVEAQAGWKEICTWVLDSPEIAKCTRYHFLPNKIGDAVKLIVFVRYHQSRLKDDWSHALLFSDILNNWVRVIGHNPEAYSSLITMLQGPGWQFAPEPTLEWLNRCASNAVHDLWNEERGNGRRTAELLNRIWNGFERQIRGNRVILQRYSNLVYRLVEAGIPLASVLRQKLEGRG
jgi:hypothetical protein